jgi:hypothetical protein
LNEKLDTDAVYIDFARAFDSASVPKLIHKLSCIGIRNPVLSCIKSFLENRSQRLLLLENHFLVITQLLVVSLRVAFWDQYYLFYMSMMFLVCLLPLIRLSFLLMT